MPVAVVLTLQPVGEGRLPVSHGAFAYAAALDLFLRLDPACAGELHETAPHKPMTVSPLFGPWKREGGEFLLSPEGLYSWRLTGLTPHICEHLHTLSSIGGGVRIGNAVFSIAAVATTSEANSEAGQIEYKALWERWEARSAIAPVMLHFLTPTTFRVGRFEQPFPLPRWVFGSLLDVWNAFAPYPLGDLRDLVEEAVVLSNWKGETRRVELGGYRTVGFVGKFAYRVLHPLPELHRLIGLLSEFAFYAGVGWQTTHGLGQVRPEIHLSGR